MMIDLNNEEDCAHVSLSIYICYTRYFYSRVQIYIQSSIIFLRDFKLISSCLVHFFWYVGIQDVNRSIPYESGTIHGTKKMHSVKIK
jgi:hypothetical protein